MVLRYYREQLVKKYQGKLCNSRNSLVTEQAAKACYTATSTGDIHGRDESPICQRLFRCNQICHNVKQWPGWCTRGLFSPKWVCDLSLVLIAVCGTVCVCLCSIPNVPMCTWSLDVSWSVLSVLQTLSVSFLPIYSLLIHFSYISIFTSWLLILCFSVPSCLFLSSFHRHWCVLSCCCTCAWECAHMPLFTLTALLSSCLSSNESCEWRRAGRRRIFPSPTELLGIAQFGFERPPWYWKYPGPTGIWCLTRGGALTLLCGSQICFTSDSLGCAQDKLELACTPPCDLPCTHFSASPT